jgi:ectoine hydroxylase-related dioxygenase (phytanoyl-CoA dioxygenase family)
MVAIQCTYFEKSESKNWLVSLHRDYFVPLVERISSARWKNWSRKEGAVFCRPPDEVLKKLVAIRIHLDHNFEFNGPLKVVPGSHTSEVTEGETVNCHVSRGGALVFHPLLLHASSKVELGKRRVLHILFGPRDLPDNAKWANTVKQTHCFVGAAISINT